MSEDLLPRTRVALRYQVGELVRRRPYANVYSATRDDGGPPFTVWQLRGIFAVTPPGIDRFDDGLAAVRAISNASIARIVAHEVLPAGPLIVTETVRGPTLRERLLRSHRLPRPDVVSVVRGVASVLDELHGHDPPLLHRALSPDEIHIDADRCVVQACGFVHAMTFSGMLRGTHTGFAEPAYRVPESLAETQDPRADLFALASVVFECLTGERAFGGDDPVTVANAIRKGKRPSAVALRAEIPAGVDEILARAWSPEVKNSYPTAWSFARDLTSALEAMRPAAPKPVRRVVEPPRITDTGPQLVMSEPSVLVQNPDFEIPGALVPNAAHEAPPPVALRPAPEDPITPPVRGSLYTRGTPIDNEPLFAERPPRGNVPFGVSQPQPEPPRKLTIPPPASANIPFSGSSPSVARTPSIAPPRWQFDLPEALPEALPEDEPHDDAETREYDDRLGRERPSDPDTLVYSTNLVAKVDRMHRAGAGRLVRQEPEAPAPPVGRAPPPASGSVRSVMRAETLQPPTGARAEVRSIPPPARPLAADAPPIGVVPGAARPVATPGYVPSQHHAGAAPNVMRANTVPGLGNPLRGPSQPQIQGAFRGPSTPSLSSPLRAPSGPQVMFSSDANRPPPVGVVPSASGGGQRARVATASPYRADPARTPSHGLPQLSAENVPAPPAPVALAVLAPAPQPAQNERVPTAFPNINRAPVKLLSPTPPPLVVPHPNTLFGLHRSAVVLGGSIVLAALIFTVGQVYVAQQPASRVEAVERSHVRAEPTDATRLSLSSAVEQCVPRPYPSGISAVRFNVTYEGASGHATAVRVDPPFGALPAAQCISRAARASAVPAFASSIDSVDYVIPLY